MATGPPEKLEVDPTAPLPRPERRSYLLPKWAVLHAVNEILGRSTSRAGLTAYELSAMLEKKTNSIALQVDPLRHSQLAELMSPDGLRALLRANRKVALSGEGEGVYRLRYLQQRDAIMAALQSNNAALVADALVDHAKNGEAWDPISDSDRHDGNPWVKGLEIARLVVAANPKVQAEFFARASPVLIEAALGGKFAGKNREFVSLFLHSDRAGIPVDNAGYLDFAFADDPELGPLLKEKGYGREGEGSCSIC